jgi:hypothetical protein
LGVLILEPAEPLPPFSRQEQEFEQLQTTYMFRLRDCIIAITKGKVPEDLEALADDISSHFGSLPHPVAFSQTIRSSEDYNYKHSVCTAMLCAIIAHGLNLLPATINELVTAALLADIGYLYVPQNLLTKPEDELSDVDVLSMDQYRAKALELLEPDTNPFALGDHTIRVLREFLKVSRKEDPTVFIGNMHMYTKILMVADKYDRMTAMSLNYRPVSSLQALRHLQSKPLLYEKAVVNALSNALQILPVGQCVELSTNQRGLVLSDDSSDQFHPQILDFATNEVLDLASDKLKGVIEVKDLMQTMDMRYPFDEESLKQFEPDEELQATTRRIRKRLEKSKKREAAKKARVLESFS